MMSALVISALSLVAPSATAQTGYPPGPCSVLSGSQFAGNVTVGQTFTVTVAPTCLWTSGATANIVVNGSGAFTEEVNADGTVTLTITILSTTQASINGIVVPVACGINTIQVTAPSAVAGNRLVTQTITFNLICPGVPSVNICNAGDGGDGGSGLGIGGNASSTGGTGGGTGGTSTGGAGTGIGGGGGAGGDACNVNLGGGTTATTTPGSSGGGGGGGSGGAGGDGGAGGAGGAGGGGGAGGAGGAAGAAGAAGAPGRAGTAGAAGVQGFLARTGDDLARYGAVALALVLVGTGLTVAARRRRAAH